MVNRFSAKLVSSQPSSVQLVSANTVGVKARLNINNYTNSEHFRPRMVLMKYRSLLIIAKRRVYNYMAEIFKPSMKIENLWKRIHEAWLEFKDFWDVGAKGQGFVIPIYRMMRTYLSPFLRLFLRLRMYGFNNIPRKGK